MARRPAPAPARDRPVLRVLGRLDLGGSPVRSARPEPGPSHVAVLVAVAHAAAREGVSRFLGDVLDLDVAAVGTGAETLEAARTGRYRVLLLDAAVTEPDAFEVMGRLRTEQPDLRILFLAAADTPALPLRALAFGAAGHLDAGSPASEYVAAVRTVARGERYLSPLLREALVEQAGSGSADGPRLSAREFQVLRLLVQGRGTAAIADALAIAPSTVRTFKARLREKLGVDSDVALVRYALDLGID